MSIDNLSDVNAGTPTDGYLSYDQENGVWNGKQFNLGVLTNVDMTGLASDSILKYDNTEEKWMPEQLKLALPDVTGTASVGTVLKEYMANMNTQSFL